MFETLRRHYYDQPHEVSIETLAHCNARCGFCPYGSLGREGERLEDGVIERLIEEMSTWRMPFYIAPFKVNDPLLDPRMVDICQDIERRIPQAKIRLFTNGSALTGYHRTWIANLKHLDELWISLNSCEPVEYHRMMKLNYLQTARRLRELHDALEFPHRVTVSRVATGGEDGHGQLIPDAADLQFVADVKRDWPRFHPFLIKRDGWLGAVQAGQTTIPKTPCARWFELSVTATGTVALCCMDGQNQFPIGSIHERTLMEIYNQPHLKKRRLYADTREGIEPCQRCTY